MAAYLPSWSPGSTGEPAKDHHDDWWTNIQSRVARQETDMTTDLIQSTYRRTWWALVLRGLLGIATGAVILWRPLESVAALALIIAVWAIFSGTVQIVHAVDLRQVFSRWWVVLLGGLVSVAFGGAAIYFYPVLSLAFAVTWTAYVAAGHRHVRDLRRDGGAPARRPLGLGRSPSAFWRSRPARSRSSRHRLRWPRSWVSSPGLVWRAGSSHLIGAYQLAAFKSDVRRVTSVATAH